MAQPQAARITCNLCSGWYNSERELRDHMQTVHRRFVSDQSTLQTDRKQQDKLKHDPDPSKEK
jgi:hypothetical protein